MEQSRIDRINELAKKAKTVGLTPEEDAERAQLRQEYLAAVRQNLRAQLDDTPIVDENCTKRPLRKQQAASARQRRYHHARSSRWIPSKNGRVI